MTMFFGVLLAKMIGLHAEGERRRAAAAGDADSMDQSGDGRRAALALGVDPADADVMNRPPRPRSEGVITRRMWMGIFFVGAIMAVGTLLVLDASLPGGLIEGNGEHALRADDGVYNADDVSTLQCFQRPLGRAKRLPRALSKPLAVGRGRFVAGAHVAVIYVPFLQNAFSTMSLSFGDWLRCAAVASSVLWLRELSKWITRQRFYSQD